MPHHDDDSEDLEVWQNLPLPPRPNRGRNWGITDFRLWLIGAVIVTIFFWDTFARMAGCRTTPPN